MALKIIEKLKDQIDLVRTKEILLSSDDAARIFGSSSTKVWQAAKKGELNKYLLKELYFLCLDQETTNEFDMF